MSVINYMNLIRLYQPPRLKVYNNGKILPICDNCVLKNVPISELKNTQELLLAHGDKKSSERYSYKFRGKTNKYGETLKKDAYAFSVYIHNKPYKD